ncbi:MAG: hypothetical protein BWY70_00631 [Bacteroidetes bacterium ADurb.Bin408]|nr:MAG: hypothetical protein BWY70_00631 [Bacteroidetes bacterium ADurb.Bin408]
MAKQTSYFQKAEASKKRIEATKTITEVSFLRVEAVLKNVLIILIFVSSFSPGIVDGQPAHASYTLQKLLDNFHQAAAQANFEAYFSFFAEDAVFMGTDATERWDKAAFMKWARPFFDRGKVWQFTALQRHISTDKTGNTAWFDELLDTQMKICRGSGVLVKLDDGWKIRQYVLSMTIPNEKSDSIIKIKTPLEEEIIEFIKEKKRTGE